MRKLLKNLGVLIAMGTCLMLVGKTVTSIFFLLGLIVVVISSYGLGYFTSISRQAEGLLDQLKDEIDKGDSNG